VTTHRHDLAYEQRDMGAVARDGFTQTDAPDGRAVVLAGTCPRCEGRTEMEIPRGLPGTGTKGIFGWLGGGGGGVADDPEPLVGEVHFCECGHAHPAMPPDARRVGCGAQWRVRP
jgi:hypothetical protein